MKRCPCDECDCQAVIESWEDRCENCENGLHDGD